MKPKTFCGAVIFQWRKTVTGEHSALYWLPGLVLAILVTVFAWDQTPNIWVKVLCAAGIPILLLITSTISATRSAWINERRERDKLEEQLSPKISITLVDDGITTETEADNSQTNWIQFVVENTSDVHLHNCESHLLNVWSLDVNMQNERPLLNDHMRLQWSLKDDEERERTKFPATAQSIPCSGA